MPVSRLGGRPDRPTTEAVTITEADRREFERHRNQAAGIPEWFRTFFSSLAETLPTPTPAPPPVEREDPVLVEAARTSGLSIESIRLFLTTVEPMISAAGRTRAQLRANLPRMVSTLLAPGAPWKEKAGTQEATVARTEGDQVHLITTTGSEIVVTFREFLDKYDATLNAKPAETPDPPLPIKVACGEEWEETRTGQVAKVIQIDSRRNIITLDKDGVRTGSQVVPLSAFAVEWKPFVRASVYDRLIGDEDL